MAVSLTQLLQTMVQNKGSDLHVASNSSPMIRVRGDMVKLNAPPISPSEVEAMIFGIINEEQKLDLVKEKKYRLFF